MNPLAALLPHGSLPVRERGSKLVRQLMNGMATASLPCGSADRNLDADAEAP